MDCGVESFLGWLARARVEVIRGTRRTGPRKGEQEGHVLLLAREEVVGGGCRKKAVGVELARVGLFWMSPDDFATHFDGITVCHARSSQQVRRTHTRKLLPVG